MNTLLALNVNERLEKKNGLSYLSWAWAWAEVLKHDPEATWEAVEFMQPDGALCPCMYVGNQTAMVKTSVTIKGKTRTCLLPVMDHRNKAIPQPDAFAINTAIMRCMTKAISMHGLGLYIYAGEDLPEAPEIDRTLVMKVQNAIREAVADDRPMSAEEEWAGAREQGEDFAKAVWAGLTTPQRDYVRLCGAKVAA
jgi:Protein of unknown function (DUF1071)